MKWQIEFIFSFCILYVGPCLVRFLRDKVFFSLKARLVQKAYDFHSLPRLTLQLSFDIFVSSLFQSTFHSYTIKQVPQTDQHIRGVDQKIELKNIYWPLSVLFSKCESGSLVKVAHHLNEEIGSTAVTLPIVISRRALRPMSTNGHSFPSIDPRSRSYGHRT